MAVNLQVIKNIVNDFVSTSFNKLLESDKVRSGISKYSIPLSNIIPVIKNKKGVTLVSNKLIIRCEDINLVRDNELANARKYLLNDTKISLTNFNNIFKNTLDLYIDDIKIPYNDIELFFKQRHDNFYIIVPNKHTVTNNITVVKRNFVSNYYNTNIINEKFSKYNYSIFVNGLHYNTIDNPINSTRNENGDTILDILPTNTEIVIYDNKFETTKIGPYAYYFSTKNKYPLSKNNLFIYKNGLLSTLDINEISCNVFKCNVEMSEDYYIADVFHIESDINIDYDDIVTRYDRYHNLYEDLLNNMTPDIINEHSHFNLREFNKNDFGTIDNYYIEIFKDIMTYNPLIYKKYLNQTYYNDSVKIYLNGKDLKKNIRKDTSRELLTTKNVINSDVKVFPYNMFLVTIDDYGTADFDIWLDGELINSFIEKVAFNGKRYIYIPYDIIRKDSVIEIQLFTSGYMQFNINKLFADSSSLIVEDITSSLYPEISQFRVYRNGRLINYPISFNVDGNLFIDGSFLKNDVIMVEYLPHKYNKLHSSSLEFPDVVLIQAKNKPLDLLYYDIFLNGKKLTEKEVDFLSDSVVTMKNVISKNDLVIYEKYDYSDDFTSYYKSIVNKWNIYMKNLMDYTSYRTEYKIKENEITSTDMSIDRRTMNPFVSTMTFLFYLEHIKSKDHNIYVMDANSFTYTDRLSRDYSSIIEDDVVIIDANKDYLKYMGFDCNIDNEIDELPLAEEQEEFDYDYYNKVNEVPFDINDTTKPLYDFIVRYGNPISSYKITREG